VPATVDIRRAASRLRTKPGWLDGWHSVSLGGHYDRANTHFGLLLVSNDDRVQPAQGLALTPTGTWRSSRGCSSAGSSTATLRGTTACSTRASPYG
jgi:hypothetical protein